VSQFHNFGSTFKALPREKQGLSGIWNGRVIVEQMKTPMGEPKNAVKLKIRTLPISLSVHAVVSRDQIAGKVIRPLRLRSGWRHPDTNKLASL
jgi:hypothetical protein